VDPRFVELAQPEAWRLFDEVFRSWVGRRLGTPSDVLGRCFTRLAWREERFGTEPLDVIQQAAWNLAEWRDYPAPWERRQFDRDRELDTVMTGVARLADLRDRCAKPRWDALYRSLKPAAEFRDRVARAKSVGRPDYDAWEAELVGLPREIRG